MGMLFRRVLHQPQVMGEMVAGFLLGPSLLGWLWPGLSSTLFPPESLGFLNALSQVGLVLFMFLVGLELNPKILRGRTHTALVTSHASILLPFLLGSLLALYLYPRLASDGVKFAHFALFIGTAMSITAFPVLARILTGRKLLHTPVGAVTIACAAVDDVTAWCILAGVVLVVRASQAATPFWLTLFGSLAYIGLMIYGIRPLLRRLEAGLPRSQLDLSQGVVAASLLLVLASGWMTERLGIHALFGAFLIGAIMPKDHGLAHALTEKLKPLTVTLLLPLFFAFTGLRASIGLLSGGQAWLYFGLILAVAIAGKFGGSTISARLSGMGWREAGALGILMNTRGLIELVVLNIGLEIGVITPTVFTMMVLMALVTTFMTSPLLDWIYPARLRAQVLEAQPREAATLTGQPVERAP